ncbi:hypothetical protein PoB_003261200 [Plakobranchus ocellatus]|uniref:Uncharacterized protein n=1 Tax=Plakobranchus ocellatus TaxID=259542 RepID=A0AAV4AGE2_9GAST|nr:hypothetical protein PoB_003261200 [Plakobranchus ocellatus]
MHNHEPINPPAPCRLLLLAAESRSVFQTGRPTACPPVRPSVGYTWARQLVSTLNGWCSGFIAATRIRCQYRTTVLFDGVAFHSTFPSNVQKLLSSYYEYVLYLLY